MVGGLKVTLGSMIMLIQYILMLNDGFTALNLTVNKAQNNAEVLKIEIAIEQFKF